MLDRLKKRFNRKLDNWAFSRVGKSPLIGEPLTVTRVHQQVLPYRVRLDVSVFDSDELVNLRMLEASHKLGEGLLREGVIKKVRDEVHEIEPIRTIVLEAYVAKEER